MQTVSGVIRQPIIRARRHLCSSTIGWIALTVMILSGSTTTAFGKKLTEYFSPLSMLFLSEIMLLIFAILTFGFFPMMKKIRRVHPAVMLPLLTAGVLNGVVAPVFWFTGLERTFAVNSQLFSNAETLFLILFGMLLMHSFPKRTQWFGGAIIFAGLLTVALRGFTTEINIGSGDMLIVLSGCFYGLGGALIRKYLRHMEPQIIIVARSCTAIAFFFLLSPFIAHPFAAELTSFPLEYLGVLIGYGLISRFLLIFSYYESIERLPLASVSLLGTVTVGTGLFFAHAFLGESITWYQEAGAALIILGAIVVQWGSLRKLEEHVVHYLKSHHHL
ncbi:MAG: DMT family transporter [Candidatus Peribacteraceae bacterium]|nr:DMT family transporter [Candidatus Peribacteraceae bacterium]MDD5742656.1 DMT family transporter [Candidatus Peribacteraceae bacterium]